MQVSPLHVAQYCVYLLARDPERVASEAAPTAAATAFTRTALGLQAHTALQTVLQLLHCQEDMGASEVKALCQTLRLFILSGAPPHALKALRVLCVEIKVRVWVDERKS